MVKMYITHDISGDYTTCLLLFVCKMNTHKKNRVKMDGKYARKCDENKSMRIARNASKTRCEDCGALCACVYLYRTFTSLVHNTCERESFVINGRNGVFGFWRCNRTMMTMMMTEGRYTPCEKC